MDKQGMNTQRPSSAWAPRPPLTLRGKVLCVSTWVALLVGLGLCIGLWTGLWDRVANAADYDSDTQYAATHSVARDHWRCYGGGHAIVVQDDGLPSNDTDRMRWLVQGYQQGELQEDPRWSCYQEDARGRELMRFYAPHGHATFEAPYTTPARRVQDPVFGSVGDEAPFGIDYGAIPVAVSPDAAKSPQAGR